MRYICEKYQDKGTKLYGTTLKDKAMVEQWLEIESQECIGPMFDLVNQVFFDPLFHGKASNPNIVNILTEKLGKVLDVYDAQLSKHKYLAGDFISLADISHLPVCNYYFNIASQHELFKTRKYVNGWWQDISSRLSWKKILKKAMPDIEAWKASMK
jgi:glutathione S-transferase